MVALVLLSLVSAGLGAGVVERLSSGGFAVEDSGAARATELLSKHFDMHESDLVIAYQHPGWTIGDPRFEAALDTVTERLRVLPFVAQVLDPATRGPALVSKDRRIALVVVSLRGEDDRTKLWYRRQVEHVARATPLDARVGGRIEAYHVAQQLSRDDLVRAELIALPLAFGLLLWLFRSVVAALIPLVIGGVSIASAMLVLRGMAEITDVSVFAMNVVTFLGFGLAVDYSLFIVRRFREELDRTHSTADAVARTVATAGRTVIFSGVAVAVSLLGLLWFDVPLLESIAIGGTSITLVTLVVAVVFLPAVLGTLGRRIDAGRLRRRRGGDIGYAGGWYRLARAAMARPLVVGLIVTAALLVVASPVRRLKIEAGDAGLFPARTEVRQVWDLAERSGAFVAGELSPIDVLVEASGHSRWNGTTVRDLAVMIRAIDGVVRVDAIPAPDARVGYLRVVPAFPPHDPRARQIVEDIRASMPTSLRAYFGGRIAVAAELRDELESRAPLAFATIVVIMFVALFLAFGSVVLPIKAILLNTLSVLTGYGALVWIFQDGRFERLLDYQSPGAIDPSILAVTFAVSFGLSMDYEVFLLSRIREEHDSGLDNAEAVARGLGRTARLITGAALVLVAVVAGFVAGQMIFIKQLGVGLAVIVLVDATIIRALLVPTSMAVLGRLNWWAPRPLARMWSRLGVRIDERAEPDRASPPPARHNA